MPRVNSLQNYEYYMTLYNRVKSMEQNPSLIRERYGSIGVDIFEGGQDLEYHNGYVFFVL